MMRISNKQLFDLLRVSNKKINLALYIMDKVDDFEKIRIIRIVSEHPLVVQKVIKSINWREKTEPELMKLLEEANYNQEIAAYIIATCCQLSDNNIIDIIQKTGYEQEVVNISSYALRLNKKTDEELMDIVEKIKHPIIGKEVINTGMLNTHQKTRVLKITHYHDLVVIAAIRSAKTKNEVFCLWKNSSKTIKILKEIINKEIITNDYFLMEVFLKETKIKQGEEIKIAPIIAGALQEPASIMRLLVFFKNQKDVSLLVVRTGIDTGVLKIDDLAKIAKMAEYYPPIMMEIIKSIKWSMVKKTEALIMLRRFRGDPIMGREIIENYDWKIKTIIRIVRYCKKNGDVISAALKKISDYEVYLLSSQM